MSITKNMVQSNQRGFVVLKGKKFWINVCRAIFILYILGLCYFLLFAEVLGFGRTHESGVYQYNLELFKEIERFIRYRHQLGFKAVFLNLGGNVLGFVPFGFLLPVLFSDTKRMPTVICLTFLLSLCFETLQLIFKAGSFDVDDLLLNTAGGLLGYILYKVVSIRSSYGKRQKKL